MKKYSFAQVLRVCSLHVLIFVPLSSVTNIIHTTLRSLASQSQSCQPVAPGGARVHVSAAFKPRTNMTYLLIIGLLNILCFPSPSNFSSSFKEAMNNEASFASSFVRVTMLACQAKASDPLFQ